MTSCLPFETVFITFIIEKDFVRKKGVELAWQPGWLGHLTVEQKHKKILTIFGSSGKAKRKYAHNERTDCYGTT
jgi:hypothetical protein